MNTTSSKLSILLLFLGTSVFLRLLEIPYLPFDDQTYFYQNALVMRGLSLTGFFWALETPFFGHWMPITWLSNMTVVEFFGPGAMAQRACNYALHFLSACFLYFALLKLSRNNLLSIFVSLVFVIHPLQIEPVVWVSSRKDVLAGLFWNIGFYFYCSREKPGVAMYACFLLGLMSKATLITFPVFWIALDILFKKRVQILEKLPMLLCSLWYVFHTLSINSEKPQLSDLSQLTLIEKILNAVWSLLNYLYLYLLPINLSISYPQLQANMLKSAIAIAVLLVITFFTWREYRKGNTFVPFAWIWFVISIGPFLKLKQIGVQSMADRYMYIPHIGLSILLFSLVCGLLSKQKYQKICLSLLCLFFLLLHFKQSQYWISPIRLFEHAVEVTKNDSMTHLRLANALADAEAFPSAVEHYKLSLKFNPHEYRAFAQLHKIAIKHKNFEPLESTFQRLHQKRKLSDQQHTSSARMLIKVLEDAKMVRHYQDTFGSDPAEDAQWHFQQVVASPVLIELYKANLAAATGNNEQAKMLYKKSIELYPRNALAYLGLAAINYNEGHFGKAQELSFKAFLQNPTLTLARKLQRLSTERILEKSKR